MLPILLNLGFLKIYTFGIFLVLSFFWGAFLLWKNIRLTVFKEEDIFDGVFISIFAGLFLGRFFYVILNFGKFGFNFLKFILINGYPGISLYGFLIGALIGLCLCFSYKKIRFLEVIDYFISPVLLSLGIGKLGSFFSGREMVPLYEAILFFFGAYLAHKLLFEIRRDKYPFGFSFYFFLWLFALSYFSFDKIKEHRLYLFGQSFNGFISLILFVGVTTYFGYYFRNYFLKLFIYIKNSIGAYARQTYTKVHKATRTKAAKRS